MPDGFEVELVASEPQIMDPVAIAFDGLGGLFVAEMPEYPLGGSNGRIKLLRDEDGDGYFEWATVFAEEIGFPNGLMPWREGILVTAAPHILYLGDTDADDRADVREVVLTGFAATNPQLRVNGLTYGLDNWIYAAYPRAGGARRYDQFDDSGEAIRFPEHPEAGDFHILPGTDFRFSPDLRKVEAVGGMSQYGNAFDEWGNRFTVWNNDHIRHVVIQGRYLSRNPHFAVRQAMHSISDHSSAAPLYPITGNPFHIHESEIGHFTSACGTLRYTGGAFPREYSSSYFVCDPVHNVIHCDILTREGISFVARRDRPEAEFVSSADSWFRPVFTTLGPDGAVYITDFYRKLVEHPEFIPEADESGFYVYQGVLEENDFLEGHDLGRIYRLRHGAAGAGAEPALGEASWSELVRGLLSPNMWWRLTAQRLLVEQKNSSAVPALETLARETPTVEAGVHALWVLEGLQALDTEVIARALEHSDPHVRVQALRLAEKRLPDPEWEERLITMAADPDERVQFQLVCTLGQVRSRQSFAALRRLLRSHLENPWFQTAVLSSVSEDVNDWLLATVEDFGTGHSQYGEEFVRHLGSIVGSRGVSREVTLALRMIDETRTQVDDWWRAAVLEGLTVGLRSATPPVRLSAGPQNLLLHLARTSSSEIRQGAAQVLGQVELSASRRLTSTLRRMAGTVRDPQAELDDRVQATRLLALDPAASFTSELVELLAPAQPAEMQLAAAETLVSGRQSASVDPLLLERWQTHTAPVREVILEAVFSRPARLHALLDALEKGHVRPDSLDRSSRQRLMRFPDQAISERSKVLLADSPEDQSQRTEAFKRFHPALQVSGDIDRGQGIFRERCSVCHRIGGAGVEVGPDLLSLSRRTKQYFLREIMDPGRNITPGYEEYIVETADGRLLTGVLAENAPTAVTLRRREGAEDTILRNNIRSMRLSTVSHMPEDLAEGMGMQEMADLLEYLNSLGR